MCVSCQFTTPLKSNYSNHLLTRKHLSHNPIEANMLVQMLAADSPMLATPEPMFKCKYCEQCYKHRSSLSKHIKYSCTKNKDEDLTELVRLLNKRIEQQEKSMENQRQELTKTIETQSKQIEKLMGKLEISGSFNTTNNTINHFTLLPYRETDVSHLTDQDYRYCIKRVNHCVKSMIEKVHFNPLKPENMNIYISNIKDKYIMVYDGANWNLANRKAELDRLYEEKEMMLEEWLETNPEEELKQKFIKYLENKDNDECLNRVKEEIKLLLYNNQKLVLKNSV